MLTKFMLLKGLLTIKLVGSFFFCFICIVSFDNYTDKKKGKTKEGEIWTGINVWRGNVKIANYIVNVLKKIVKVGVNNQRICRKVLQIR